MKGTEVDDRMVKLCCISMASRVCDGEILQQSRVSTSPHRGEKIYSLPYAGPGGRKREEAILQ